MIHSVSQYRAADSCPSTSKHAASVTQEPIAGTKIDPGTLQTGNLLWRHHGHNGATKLPRLNWLENWLLNKTVSGLFFTLGVNIHPT